MLQHHPSPIVGLTTRIAQPFLYLFGVYVLLHGHESPGGGFQAGTLLGAAIILEAVSFGTQSKRYLAVRNKIYRIAALGVLIYAGVGLFGLFGNAFLDYSALPIAAEPAARRWWGILFVEVGVCLVVMASLVSIFDRLLSKEPHDG